MLKLSTTTLAVALTLGFGSAPAEAALLAFTGSMTGFGVSGPDATCAPLPFRGILNGGTGNSTLGSFNYSHNICLSGFSGPMNGAFTIDFGGDQLLGTILGSTSPNATPGVANLAFNYTVTGGTGRFLGSSGMFTGIGTTDTRTGGTVNLVFNGTVNAVPEPATWAMFMIGFGAVGYSMRSRKVGYKAFQAA